MHRPALPLLAIVVGACAHSVAPGPWPGPEPRPALWVAALTEFIRYSHPHGEIRLRPFIGGGVRDTVPDTMQVRMMHVPKALYIAWLRANLDSVQLRQPPALPGHRVALATPTDMVTAGRYTYELSQPGMSAAGDSGLVSVGSYCGMLCGRFSIYLLVRQPNGTWKAIEKADGYAAGVSEPSNQRLELAGRSGQGSIDRLMIREAEVEAFNSLLPAGRPQLKRGR